MKAALIQSPGRLEIQEIPEPIIGEYDALCTVLCASICNGTDHHAIRGDAFFDLRFPTILGHEGIGRVEKIGSKVKYIKIGDLMTRVVNKLPSSSGISVKPGWGSFAERGIVVDWQAMRDDGVPEEVWRPFMVNQQLPPDADPVKSTMVITWRETLAFLNRLDLKRKEKILILGTGANALAFVEHSRNKDADITVCGNPSRERTFLQGGTHNFVSYQSPDAEKTIGSFGPFDTILDAIGDAAGLNRRLVHLKPGGKIAVYGLDGVTDYRLDVFRIPQGFAFFNGIYYEEGTTHDEVLQSIKDDRLSADLYISPEHIYPFSRMNEALSASRDRKTLKSVIDFRLAD
ncbi:MAG: alcohol dehydrogenase catalytic domain-containing protein [Patescibacteria group bacterium]|nr:alcohol dehydrogenase catalytic domain-containing protein [Patescibacteria group bacterium]